MAEPGMITPETIARALDDLWQSGRSRPDFTGLAAITGNRSPAACGVRLFAPDESLIRAVRLHLIANWTPVPSRLLARLQPVQGPAPAACAREPHPGSAWHWDGSGTWWEGTP